MQVINQRALVAALTEFGERLGAQLGDACPRDTFQLALTECLKDLPQQKVKTPKSKVSKGPSKTELKKAALIDELAKLGGIVPEDDSIQSIRNAVKVRKKEIKAEEKAAKAEEKKQAKLKAATEKKSLKKMSPGKKEYTDRVLLDEEKEPILGNNGSKVRVSIHKETRKVIKKVEDNWTEEANARYTKLFPTGFELKVTKKKVIKKVSKKISKKIKKKISKKSAEEKLATDQKALIAAMVGDAVGDKLESKAIPPVVAPVVAPVEEESEDEELEELEEEEIVEEEIPDFPGEEAIEEFEHDDLKKYTVDFYVDEDANVWDENMSFVGKYNEDDDTLKITEGYEPEDEE
jgi:hypothetical protein